MSFDEDPLDLLEDNGDGVIETAIFFDEEEQKKERPPQNTGCCIVLVLIGSTIVSFGYEIIKILA